MSFLLLLVYTLGVGHNVIPHCHHGTAGEGQADSHSHEHHTHSADEDLDHSHFEHADHLDHCVIDFLICVLSDSEHPHGEEENCHFLLLPPNVVSLKSLKQNKFYKALLHINSESAIEKADWFEYDAISSYVPPSFSTSKQRGPPQVS